MQKGRIRKEGGRARRREGGRARRREGGQGGREGGQEGGREGGQEGGREEGQEGRNVIKGGTVCLYPCLYRVMITVGQPFSAHLEHCRQKEKQQIFD